MSSNITHADLISMRTNFVGGSMGSMLYGTNLCVYIAAIYFLFRRSSLNWTMITFSTLLFVGATIMMGLNTKLDQIMLIDSQINSSQLRGASQPFSSPLLQNRLNLTLNGVYLATNFIADLLIIFRLYFVGDRRLAIIAVPGLLFLASTACSIIVESKSAAGIQLVVSLGILSLTLSVAVTILATILIIIRLMTVRQTLKRLLGKDHGTPYVSITAMIIESAAIYSIVGIFFIGFMAANHPAQNVLNPMVSQAMCLAPNLIIMRVAAGQSFPQPEGTLTVEPSIHFSPGLTSPFVDSQATHGIWGRSASLATKGLAHYDTPSSGVTLTSLC